MRDITELIEIRTTSLVNVLRFRNVFFSKSTDVKKIWLEKKNALLALIDTAEKQLDA